MHQTEIDNGDHIAGKESSVTPSRMLGKMEIATLLGCSIHHLDRMVEEGRVPRPVKFGALARWPSAAFAKWMAAGCPVVGNTED